MARLPEPGARAQAIAGLGLALLLFAAPCVAQPAATPANAEKFVALMIPRAVTRVVSMDGRIDFPRTFDSAATRTCRTELPFVETANGSHFVWVIDWSRVSAISAEGTNTTVRGPIAQLYQGQKNFEFAGLQFDFGDARTAERFRNAATVLRDACDPAKGLGF